MKIKTILSLLIVQLFFLSTSILSEEVVTVSTSKELIEASRFIDERIAALYKVLSSYSLFLNKKQVKNSPQNTIVKVDSTKRVVQLESYAFITQSVSNANLVGLEYKLIRLFFDTNTTLSKVEIEIGEDNFFTHTKRFIKLEDTTPDSVSTDDIHLYATKNDITFPDMTLLDIENTDYYPIRNSYKKDFYLKSLRQFQSLLEKTEGFQRLTSDGYTFDNLQYLKRSLPY